MKLLLCVLCGLCVINPCFAQQDYTGSAVIEITDDKTLNQARKEAFDQALKSAVQQAGIEVSSGDAGMKQESASGFYDNFVQFTSVRAKGLVTSIDTLFDDQIDQPVVGGKLVRAYKVELKARIQPAIGKPNPAFKLEMSLNRESFHSGETLTIALQPTLDCYVTIFNLYSNDSLNILLPNEMYAEQFITANRKTIFPPENAHWDLPVELTSGRDSDQEALYAVATLKPIPFPTLAGDLQRGLIAYGDAMLSINRWLVDIPLDQRTEAWEFYKIYK